jgi:two-component system LytT family response regulator
MMRAWLVDDEPLALERLQRMLEATGRVEVVGSQTDPVDAVESVRAVRPDVLFLDIHMPDLSGFDLLARLTDPPLVIFTTAYDQHALQAFQANSVDYLLKPIEPAHLDRALTKAERLLGQPSADAALIERLRAALQPAPERWLSRIGSRSGDKVEFVDLRHVTHFFARDRLTFAAAGPRKLVIDQTITQLARKLDPNRFVQVHRNTIVNVDSIQELHAVFGGRMVARLKDQARTELQVSRDRVRNLKQILGL